MLSAAIHTSIYVSALESGFDYGLIIPGFWVRIPEGPPGFQQARQYVWPVFFSSQWFSLTNSLLTHFRTPSVGCARCRRHGTGPSTTFSPGPSTIPRISRKPQAVYLRFYFCPRRHGHGCRPNVVDGPHPWREVPGGRRPGAGKEGGGVATARGARPRGRKGHRGASRPVPAPASAAGLRSLAAARKIFGSVRPGLTFRPVIFLRLHNGRPLSNLNPARGDAPETGRVARLALPFHADLPANSPSPRRAPAS